MKISPQYIAGVIDSDGSISLARRHKNRDEPTYQSLIQITWNYNQECIDFFNFLVNKYGGSYFIGKRHPGFKTKTTQVCKYMITGDKSKNLLNDIYPYLILKKKQAEINIEYRNTVFNGKQIKYLKNKVYQRKPFALRLYHDLLYIQMLDLKGKLNECN